MIRVVIAPGAREDLKHIWRYLANEASLNIADQAREKVLATFDTLARHPGIGHEREDRRINRVARMRTVAMGQREIRLVSAENALLSGAER
jgi:plasmid stabilization system protein ParE